MKKRLSLWSIIIISFVALILVSYYAINPLLNELLKKQVEQKLIGNFSYSYDTIEVSLLKRSVKLQNVSWQFPKDSSKLNHKGKVKSFEVNGISWTSLFGKLDIKNLLIASPEFNTKIEVNRLLNNKADSIRLNQFDFYQLIAGKLESLNIDHIAISDAQAKWYSPDFKTVWRELSGGNLIIEDLKIDSATTVMRNGMFDLKQFELSFDKARIFLSDSLHFITLGQTSLNLFENNALIDSLEIHQIVKKPQIKAHFKYEKTAIDLIIPELRCDGIDYHKLFTEQYIAIEQVAINKMSLKAYKDKNATDPYDRAPPLPQKLIQQLSKTVKIDSLFVHDAFISYTQKAETTDVNGYIFFDQLNATISHITNDSTLLTENPICLLDVKTKLYGQSLLSGKVFFDVTSPKQAHTVTMELAPFDLKEANKMLTPVMAYQIRSGQSNKLKFSFNANNKQSTGELTFLYDNLKLDKLSEVSLEKNQIDEQLFSLLANSFVIKTANPDWLGKERAGTISFDRNIHKSIFHYWWYSVLSGLKTIATPSQ